MSKKMVHLDAVICTIDYFTPLAIAQAYMELAAQIKRDSSIELDRTADISTETLELHAVLAVLGNSMARHIIEAAPQ